MRLKWEASHLQHLFSEWFANFPQMKQEERRRKEVDGLNHHSVHLTIDRSGLFTALLKN